MRLHVITACSRPWNLQAVADSITEASCDPWQIDWHVVFDLAKTHVGGQGPKNRVLDQITDGWVFVLDDDTLMHPDLLTKAAEHIADVDAIVVSQERINGRVLHAAPTNLKVGRIDAGQALMRRDLIGLERFPEVYVGDGYFMETVLGAASNVVFLPEVLSWHNRMLVAQ